MGLLIEQMSREIPLHKQIPLMATEAQSGPDAWFVWLRPSF